MIISSWNVNSVRARISNIQEYLKKFSPDVLMMQEIKTQDETYPYDDMSKLKYKNYVFGQKSYNGVAILSKKEIDNVSQNKFGDFIILTKEDLNINNQILIDNFPYKLNKLI